MITGGNLFKTPSLMFKLQLINIAILGSVGSWNLGDSLRVNLLTVIIISACGVMFIVATIVAVIVISHRVMSSSSGHNDPRAKQSPASHHQLLYDQVLPGLLELLEMSKLCQGRNDRR